MRHTADMRMKIDLNVIVDYSYAPPSDKCMIEIWKTFGL
jgi:hypothetical protein